MIKFLVVRRQVTAWASVGDGRLLAVEEHRSFDHQSLPRSSQFRDWNHEERVGRRSRLEVSTVLSSATELGCGRRWNSEAGSLRRQATAPGSPLAVQSTISTLLVNAYSHTVASDARCLRWPDRILQVSASAVVANPPFDASIPDALSGLPGMEPLRSPSPSHFAARFLPGWAT